MTTKDIVLEQHAPGSPVTFEQQLAELPGGRYLVEKWQDEPRHLVVAHLQQVYSWFRDEYVGPFHRVVSQEYNLEWNTPYYTTVAYMPQLAYELAAHHYHTVEQHGSDEVDLTLLDLDLPRRKVARELEPETLVSRFGRYLIARVDGTSDEDLLDKFCGIVELARECGAPLDTALELAPLDALDALDDLADVLHTVTASNN